MNFAGTKINLRCNEIKRRFRFFNGNKDVLLSNSIFIDLK